MINQIALIDTVRHFNAVYGTPREFTVSSVFLYDEGYRGISAFRYRIYKYYRRQCLVNDGYLDDLSHKAPTISNR